MSHLSEIALAGIKDGIHLGAFGRLRVGVRPFSANADIVGGITWRESP